jgi:hypothetical protein
MQQSHSIQACRQPHAQLPLGHLLELAGFSGVLIVAWIGRACRVIRVDVHGLFAIPTENTSLQAAGEAS